MDRQENGIGLRLGTGGWMRIIPIAPHTFRIRLNETGDFSESPLVRYGIVCEPDRLCDYSTLREGDTLTFRTESAALCVDTRNGLFSLSGDNGRTCIRSAGAPWSSAASGFGMRLSLTADETIYGLGDVSPERLNRRGQKVDMWVAGTNFHSPIPFAMSSRGWALLMNTSWKHTIDVGCEREDELRVEGAEGQLDVYLICGSDYGQLLRSYTDIAGKPRLLPAWAYGLHYFCSVESGWRQVAEDALKFRQEGIPCDLIGLSDGWTADEQGGADIAQQREAGRYILSPVPGSESSALIERLHRHGFKLSLMLFGDCDISALTADQTSDSSLSSEFASEWAWLDQLLKFIDNGVDAFKVPSRDQALPHPDKRYANGMVDNEMHNLFPVLLGKTMFDSYRRRTGKRPMIHAVVGYTGMQRYTATECGKYGLRSTAVISALNSGLSGHAHTAIHMHVDEPEGIHAGFLLPWAQNNSGRHFRHPCFLDEKQRDLFRTYARLRYALLPYLYSAAHISAQTGMPIARAMPIAFPDDPRCADLCSQYMLGADLLVAVFTDRVYLPAGLWIDYWTEERIEGPRDIAVRVPDYAGGPLYVRAGAIIPMRPDADYIAAAGEARTIVHVYPHESGEYELIEDDGVSFDYTRGRIAVTRIRSEERPDRTAIGIWRRSGAYEGMPERKSYEVIVHAAAKPETIEVNGRRCPEQTPLTARKYSQSGWKYDRRAGTVRFYVDEATTEETVRIDIRYRATEKARLDAAAGEDEAAGVSGEEDGNVREDARKWLHIALDTCDPKQVEVALDAWWNDVQGEQTSPGVNWRTHVLDGCLLLVRHAERRGWTIGDGFGEELANPLSHADVQTPEQGLALLRELAGELIAAAKKTVEAVRHPIIRDVIGYVQRGLHRKLSLQEAAERAGIHPVYLSRLFKKEIGLPFSDYVFGQRMLRAKALLEAGMKVYEAAGLSGFPDASHFSRVYSRYWGRAPVSFRKKD